MVTTNFVSLECGVIPPDLAADASSPVKLSPAQKRDVFGMAVAAVISVGFFSVPLIVAPAGDVQLMAERTPVPQAAQPAVAAAAIPTPVAIDMPATTVAAVVTPPRRADVIRPKRRLPEPASMLVRASLETQLPPTLTKDEPMRRPLAGRFARLFTGDGTHPIRPFPTVANER